MEDKKEGYVSLNVCGHCGRIDVEHCEKVVFSGYGDVLCYSCRCAFEDSIKETAKHFLDNPK